MRVEDHLLKALRSAAALLLWLDRGDQFKDSRRENECKAFVEVCKSLLGFDPQNHGQLVGGAKLAYHEGPWKAVWQRYRLPEKKIVREAKEKKHA